MLFFESPPTHAHEYVNTRYQKPKNAGVESTITIRVFLRVMQREGCGVPGKEVTPEQEKELFKKLLSKTPINDTSSIIEHPITYDGEGQAYIDVSDSQLSIIALP